MARSTDPRSSVVGLRDTDRVLFGAFVPQGWKMELVGLEGASAKWERAVEIAVLAESLGYDSLWVYDHMHNIPKPAHEAVFECWTVMAALSQRTERIRLGQMVGCNSYRHPSMLAKITATVDVISGGRLEWGIGAGWCENEYKGYGFEFPRPKERIGMLRESVEIVRRMWTEAETTFEGHHYTLHRANCDPKPLQQPTPPILVGGGGEQLTLRIVARSADASNFGGLPDEWARKNAILDDHCAAVGRERAEIRRTWSPELCIRSSSSEIAKIAERNTWGVPADQWIAANLVGTTEQVSEKVATYVGLGCTGFIPWCADYPDTESLERFAQEVIPNFR